MKKVLNSLFLICVAIALALALTYVLVEMVAVITANGSLTIWAENTLEAPVCIMCSISAIIAFLMSYAYKWTSGE